MGIPKEIYDFIEYELFHYTDYKKELADLSKNEPPKLVEGTYIAHLERMVRAVSNSLKRLSDNHKIFFEEYYVKQNIDKTDICYNKMFIEYRTFYYRKEEIIRLVAVEMGLLRHTETLAQKR